MDILLVEGVLAPVHCKEQERFTHNTTSHLGRKCLKHEIVAVKP